jgi:aspartate aminotransferase
VVVDSGAKPLLYEVLACLVNPGDEVIVFTPAWVSYIEQINLCDGVAVELDTTSTGYVPDPKQLEKAITAKTKCIMLNTPNNPTGVVYDAATLKAIAALALKHKIAILYDEIYERMVYEGVKHENIVSLCPEARGLTILVNGVSKAFAMTGWRIGYALGPKEFMNSLNDLKGHINTNATSISQYAAVGALLGGEADVHTMVEAFASRRKLIVKLLKAMPHITLFEPKGAFYAWFNVEKTIGKSWQGKKITSDSDFCSLLLEAKYVAAVPGSAFMGPGHVRLSYASSEEDITEGMKRLHEFLNELI